MTVDDTRGERCPLSPRPISRRRHYNDSLGQLIVYEKSMPYG